MTTPPKRALIVINVQHEYIDGKMPIEFPELSVSLPNIGRAMDHAAAHSIPVIVVQHVLPPAAAVFARDTRAIELDSSVASRPRDLLIEKTLPSAFAENDLDAWLRERGVDTLTVTGYTSNNCGESTMRDAVHRGFQAEFISDASGTFAHANRAGVLTAQELQRAVCVSMQSRYGAVATTTEWVNAVTDAAALPRDTPLGSTEAARKLMRTDAVTDVAQPS